LQPEVVTAGGFRLLSYRRGLGQTATQGGPPVHVYVEGDGRPWRGRRPPRDPTPTNPLGLRLAARDPAPSVLWLGRPCSYLSTGAGGQCDVRWWTSHRYAPAVVDALNQLIDEAVAGRQVVLVGHSGGGTLAALLAARRRDVVFLITLASPLDLRFWVERGRMTPLYGSLDPADVADTLASVPQLHLCGGRDAVVGTEVVQRFVRAIPSPNHARVEVYPDYTHICCWEQDWPEPLTGGMAEARLAIPRN
jgi:pimeloyl-ACP methyl ester carboxylesterase